MLKHIISNGECPKKLHFGCGTKILPGWWNVDANIQLLTGSYNDTWISEGKVVSPHSLPNNHFEKIFAEMVFEHIHPDMISNTLYCLYHFLKPNGYLSIIVPNFIELAKSLVKIEEDLEGMKITSLQYIDGLRNITNEFLDPTFEDEGFLHGHQSIWTPSMAKRLLSNEGFNVYKIEPCGINNFYLQIGANKLPGNPYGSPVKNK